MFVPAIPEMHNYMKFVKTFLKYSLNLKHLKIFFKHVIFNKQLTTEGLKINLFLREIVDFRMSKHGVRSLPRVIQ